MERIVIPTLDDKGLEAMIAEHFGRAPYFTMVELDDKKEISKLVSVANTGEHFGGQGHPHDQILSLNPQVVIARGMGPRAVAGFREAQVMVLQSDAGTVSEALSLYREGKLSVLTDGCHHPHRHG